MGRHRILVVDDCSRIRGIVSDVLRAKNFDVAAADAAQAAWDMLSDYQPDLVLTDVNMPGRNGMWLARMIKRHHADMPVFIMTGNGGADTLMEAFKVGMDGYVQKPIDWDSLIVNIRATIDGSDASSGAMRLCAPTRRDRRHALGRVHGGIGLS